LTIGYGRPWEDRGVANRESVGARLKRLRLERGTSQRDLSSPGVSYAYISRIEGGARVPSVKALRRLAGKLGVSVEHLKTGEPSPVERGVADAGLAFASLTTKELQTIQAAAERAAREGAQRAAEETLEDRRKAEVARLRKRLDSSPGKPRCEWRPARGTSLRVGQ
jgi:transcriptional regulator with XRE-family HTH domain